MNENTLNADWLAGFLDGDGSFGLELVKRKRAKGSIDPFYRPILSISQKDESILYKIKTYIGCGTVRPKGKKKDQFHYRIRSADQFLTFFCPLFQKERSPSFQTSKQIQYELLKEAALFLTSNYEPQNEQHQQYLHQLDLKLRQARHLNYLSQVPICWPWFIGFFEAEGTLHFDIQNSTSVRLIFKVTQKNKPLLIKIKDYFGYGNIQAERKILSEVEKPSVDMLKNLEFHEDASIYCFYITNYEHIKTKLFPLLERTQFHSKKNIVLIKWLKVCRLVIQSKQKKEKRKAPTENQFKKLKNLKKSFNKDSSDCSDYSS